MGVDLILAAVSALLPFSAVPPGKAAAIHLFSPDCTGGCPRAASLFRALERRLAHDPDILLLSVSATHPARARHWVDSWRSTNLWHATSASTAPHPTDAHDPQVCLVNRDGRLASCLTAPTVDDLAAALDRLAAPPAAGLLRSCSQCHPAGLGPLTERRFRRQGPATAYRQESFCAALRHGKDPAGTPLDPRMPRYELSDRECRSLWENLILPAAPSTPLR